MRISPLPKSLFSEILNLKKGKILLLGGPDTGKTYLLERLVNLLKRKVSLGVIDCDLGQSRVGPPTTIGWAKIGKSFKFGKNLRVRDFYFVGSLSPAGNIKRSLKGVKFILKKIDPQINILLIDTTGYIKGEEAVDFKIKKINLIKPDLIIALQKKKELEDILKNVKLKRLFIMRPYPKVKRKSFTERAKYRDNCFKRYFSSGKKILFSKSMFKRLNRKDKDLIDKIVSLQDKQGKDLALGKIIVEKEKDFLILTPLKKLKKVVRGVIGLCKWELIP